MNKSLLCLISIFTCSHLIGAPTKAAQETKSESFKAFTGKINGNKVRLRTQPDLDGKVLKEFNKGDLVAVTGENNGYFAVEPPKGTKGYIFRSYVLDGVVEGSRINVRLEPNIEAPVIGQLTGGTRVNGTISTTNTKWLEIDPPQSTRFYVAKEYIQSIGAPEILETVQKRKNETNDLLDKAYITSQNELRKPFNQINLEQIYYFFNKVITEYQDFPEQIAKAKEGMDLIQRTYLQKQIAYLESKTEQTEASFQAKQVTINSELENYQKKLTELEEQLKKDKETEITPVVANEKPFPAIELSAQMRQWIPVETAFYQAWLRQHPPEDIDGYYKAEALNGTFLQGIVEPFNQAVKNRPGDYVLKVNNVPVAYLYSTKINLEHLVGQPVKITGLKRPNNHFAYPAYYVVSVD